MTADDTFMREQLFADIASACRILGGECLAGAFGHVSARLSDREFAISRRMSVDQITPSDIDVVPIGMLALPTGIPAPLEAFIHSAVYTRRREITAVVRAHGEASTVLGLLGLPIRPLHALGAIARGPVAIRDEACLVTTAAAGDAVATALSLSTAIILRGNGIVVVGCGVAEACVRAILIEESAQLQLRALSTGRAELPFLTPAQVDALGSELGTPSQIARVWHHYKAKHSA